MQLEFIEPRVLLAGAEIEAHTQTHDHDHSNHRDHNPLSDNHGDGLAQSIIGSFAAGLATSPGIYVSAAWVYRVSKQGTSALPGVTLPLTFAIAATTGEIFNIIGNTPGWDVLTGIKNAFIPTSNNYSGAIITYGVTTSASIISACFMAIVERNCLLGGEKTLWNYLVSP